MTHPIDLNALLHPDWLALATRIFDRIDRRCGLTRHQSCLTLRDQGRSAGIGRTDVTRNRDARRHGQTQGQRGGSRRKTHQKLLQCMRPGTGRLGHIMRSYHGERKQAMKKPSVPS